MFKKVLLLFFCAGGAGTNVYGASSSHQTSNYVQLNPEKFPNRPAVEVKRDDASEFLPEDYAFLKTGFPGLGDFEEFKKGRIEELEDPIYLPLNQENFPDWPQIEIQKLHISEFSEQDYKFLKKIFPTIYNTFETFKQKHLKDDYFFFKAAHPERLDSENHLALAICQTLLIENNVLLTKFFWIAVDHAYQGKGIGKTFMNHIETNTQSDVLSLDTSKKAISFYIKLGFKEILSEEERKKYHNPYVKFSGKNTQHA